jgi:hypothetical protein
MLRQISKTVSLIINCPLSLQCTSSLSVLPAATAACAAVSLRLVHSSAAAGHAEKAGAFPAKECEYIAGSKAPSDNHH